MITSDKVISARSLAELIGISPARVSQLERDGIFVRDENGELGHDDALKAAFQWIRSGRLGEGSKLGKERLKLLKLESRLKQIQVEAAEKKLVPASEVEAAWSSIVLLTRQRLLRVASKIAPRLVFAKTEQEIEREIQQEIEECLRELSRKPAIEAAPTAHDG